MDPLSVAASVMGVAGGCLAICRSLNALKDKFADSAITLSAICTQSSLIAAALAQLQNVLLRDPDGMARQLEKRPELNMALDTALTSCVVVLSCIDQEIKKIGANEDDLSLSARAKMLFHEPVMKDLLDQLRGQCTAFTFLLQCLQLESLADIQRILESNTTVIGRIKQGSESLRKSHPAIEFPLSVLESTRTSMDAFGDNASTIGAEEFTFDDEVVNTRAYRRALAFASSKRRVEKTIQGGRRGLSPVQTTDDDGVSVISAFATPTSSWTIKKKFSFSLVGWKSIGKTGKPLSISSPTNMLHVTHVHFNTETGHFEGLPQEWYQLLFPVDFLSASRPEQGDTYAADDKPTRTTTGHVSSQTGVYNQGDLNEIQEKEKMGHL